MISNSKEAVTLLWQPLYYIKPFFLKPIGSTLYASDTPFAQQHVGAFAQLLTTPLSLPTPPSSVHQESQLSREGDTF